MTEYHNVIITEDNFIRIIIAIILIMRQENALVPRYSHELFLDIAHLFIECWYMSRDFYFLHQPKDFKNAKVQ